MQIHFNGTNYRIEFQHDLSRKWLDHADHKLRLFRDWKKGKVCGPAVLICEACSDKTGSLFRLSHLPKEQRVRKTTCGIYQQTSPSEWTIIATGAGTPNLKARDRFNRKDGRLHALRHALEAIGPGRGLLKAALWGAYLDAKQPASRRAA